MSDTRERLTRLWSEVLAPRGWRTDLPIALLTMALGLGLVVSVQAQRGPAGLALAREDDLVRILADLGTRTQRLQEGIAQLQETARQLQSGSSGIALQEARARTAELGILAGTVAAQGPGVLVEINDPGHGVTADILVDALEELRDAGAEAIDLSGVRVVTTTSITDTSDGVAVDGHPLLPPYRISAIGDPQTLAEALLIPGGVADTVASVGQRAQAVISRANDVRITSLYVLRTPRYARPVPGPSGTP